MSQISYDSCVQLLQNAKEMTRRFPPFVRGMGPEAAYWEGVPTSKPSATTVKQFIELLADAKTAFLIALPDKETRAKDLLNGFQELQALQGHIKCHPAKASELRSTVRQLVYYANQLAVPMRDRVSFIQGRSALKSALVSAMWST